MHKISEKIFAWLDPATIEPQAMEQLQNISEMPFLFRHVAVMPDCHLGKGATVGSVIATENAIIPAAVGVDIGCGMIAVKTKFFAKDLPDDLEKLRLSIERRIPLGAGGYNRDVKGSALERVKTLKETDGCPTGEKWESQLGSLGSGNHFIELSLDETDQLWVVLHSGSRGIGNQLACKHIKVAQGLCEQMFVALKDKDLAYLPAETPAFNEYIRDLHWSQSFALLNREEMMDRVIKDLSYAFFKEDGHQAEIELERINCHHNFTQIESHCSGCDNCNQGNDGLMPEFHKDDLLSTIRDFLVDYRPVRHSCGGLSLFSKQGDRVSFPLQADVQERIRRYSRVGGRALTLECSLVEFSDDRLCSCHNDRLPIASYEHSFVNKLLDDRSIFSGRCVDIQGKLLEQFFFRNDISSLSLQNDNKKSYDGKLCTRKKNVWITRKGAIQMREGQLGVIPGSMGTRSYIVAGKQNDLAFHSAPHGSGRRFSRAEARRRFTMQDFEQQMVGVICRHSEALIDELPGCYKDIDEVMENAKELVDVKHVLKQILSVKGD